MKKFLAFVVLTSILLTGCASGRAVKKSSIASRIERIIQETDPNVNIGVQITDINSNQTVFEKNASRHFMPASTNKLVTLAAALYYLGPSYRFNTNLYTDNYAKDENTINNLYIKGSGDPGLMDNDLLALVFELKQMGIKHIKGNIFIDDKVFDDVLWSKGAMWDDRSSGFSAPVSGLNFNYNRLQIKTVPAHKAKLKAHTLVRPACTYVEVSSKAVTQNSGQGQSLKVVVQKPTGEQEEWPTSSNEGLSALDKVSVVGQTTLNSEPFYSLLAVKDPSMMAATFLSDQLKNIKIDFSGRIMRKSTPAGAFYLTGHESRSLSEALIDFTKISNNVANDSLIKAIAANDNKKPASAQAGLELVKKFLTSQVGIEADTFITADGSGASRYNLITPSQLNQILLYAANRFDLGPEFMAALPLAGLDGTLWSRLKNFKGNIRAKTGTMSGVTSLAGYINGDNANRYSFVIMINGFIGSSKKYTRLQDQILGSMFSSLNDAQLANVE